MRKFRHIKTRKELTVKKSGINKKEALIFGDWELPMWVVEKSNEWEEVIERGYDILKFKDTFTGNVFEGNEEYGYSPNNERIYVLSLKNMSSEGRCVESGDIIITKVKRLSDGVEFSIGDLVTYIDANWKNVTIKEFFDSNDSYVRFSTGGSQRLENIKHAKKPLLTTEDGFDLYEGDKVWGVIGDVWKPFYQYITAKKAREKWTHGKFSTKEAAEDYILYNRRLLSLNDVFKVYPKLKTKEPLVNTKHAEDLIKLAKSKL